jgi:hypothetical protein
MTDTIQSRIIEYFRGENDECHRKLLRHAMERIDALEAERSEVEASTKPARVIYRAPVEAWSKL